MISEAHDVSIRYILGDFKDIEMCIRDSPFRGPMPLQPPTSPARLPVRQAQRTGRLPCLRGYCAASRQTPTWSYALVRKKSPPVGRCPGADGEGAGRAASKTGPPRQNHPLRESIRFAPAPLPLSLIHIFPKAFTLLWASV